MKTQQDLLVAAAARCVTIIQQGDDEMVYMELHNLLSMGLSLEDALGAAKESDPNFNPMIPLKALSYFDIATHVPIDVQIALRSAAVRVRTVTPVSAPSILALRDP